MNATKHVLLTTLLLGACGEDEPGVDGPGNEDVMEPDIGDGHWCGATYADVAPDDAVDGFEQTPRQAATALAGTFAGSVDGLDMTLDVAVDTAVQVARVERYEVDQTAPPEVVPVSICSDHYTLVATIGLDAGAQLQHDAVVDVAYFQGEDAGDGFGWDTAFFSLRTEAWQGAAEPSWDPAEMEVVEMVITGRWNGGVREANADVPASIWKVDTSFWGESAPSGTGDDATVWAGEESLFQADLDEVD